MTDGAAAVCLVASLLLNSVSIVVSIEPSETCPVFCVCDNWYELQRASCTGRHLYSIDTGAASTVQALDLSDNVISYLNNFELANAGLTSLKYLNLSGNAISEIGLNAFAGLEELTVVDLTKNHLYDILDDVFAESSSLRILKLSRNNFNSRVPKLRSFWLTELSLDSCQISHLPSDTFNGLTHIRRLDLSNNLMIQMSSAVVQTSHFLKKLSLEGNPWSCNRIMFDLQTYLQHKNIEFDEVCGTKAGPKKFEKMILGPISKQQNYHRSAIKNHTVQGAKSVIKKNTASLLNKTKARGNATDATNVVDSVRNILPYWFLAVGFLLGAASGMIVSYVWLSGKFSCSRRHGHRDALNDPSQGLSLLLNSYLRDSIDSDANVVGSCPGTPPPPYREVMLRPTLYRCPQTATNLNNNATGYREFQVSGLSVQERTGNREIMGKLQYLEAHRDDTVDVYDGAEVADPYRWLEDPDSEKTKAFVDAQNAITKPYLASCKARQDIHDRLKQLWDFPKYSCPARHGDKYYFYKNTGLQNQSVLYVQDTLDGEPTVFLDPNTFSEDGTVAITSCKFSKDGSICAYGLSSSGSDWCTIHFINTETGKKYPEILEKVKYSPMAWTHDHRGIFYGCYPDQKGKTDGSETEGNRNQKLCYHVVGTPHSEDVVVVDFPEEPLWRIGAQVSDCGKWLIITPVKDCRDNLVYFTELKPETKLNEKLQLTQVVDKFEADYEYVTNDGTKAIFRTNKNAPNYRLIAIDLLDYEQEKWVDVLAEHADNVLDWACAVDGDKFVACYIEDVKNILQLHSLNTGDKLKTFPLDVGTVVTFTGEKRYSEIFYQFTSFLIPSIIYRVDLKKDEDPEVLREIKVKDFDPSLYKTSQVFYKSKDGTKIPMFIVMKHDAVLDGSMPALLYGYGGFNVSIQPTFSVTKLVFVQHLNGVLAIPNIRGGGEYGEKWHNAGRFFNKQNVFDDFQAAAEYLIENRYTTSSKLSILGASNGGLLVAACVNQRPDLFGAAVAQVGVMDMLRFHKFTIGVAWVSDYGSSDDPKHFENLLKYSPLHNVRVLESGQYPATLLLTADHDDRVVPLHSLKLIATLQHTLGELPEQTNPLLIRIDTKAGHGGGKPTMKVIDESTDILTFIVKSLGLEFQL